MSQWERVIKCSRCRCELSDHEEMYSNGICPYCGHDADSTVCDTYNVVRRWVTTGSKPWWKVWAFAPGHWEYKPAQLSTSPINATNPAAHIDSD